MIKYFIKNKNVSKKSGYAILEIIFYIAIFSILSVAVIDSLIIMTKSFKETTIKGELAQSASIVEKISREIKQSYGINSLSTTDLVLNTMDSVGASKTVRFVLSDTDIQFYDNGTLVGNLNTNNIDITNLSFSEITTAKGKAVRLSLSLRSNHDTLGRVENFYNTVVLRGSY